MDAVERVLAKHRQARVHLKTFKDAVQEFINTNPYRLAGEFNSDCTEYVIRAYDIEAVPEAVSLIAGDVVHNARACLDHLAWEIAQNPNPSTIFPIRDSRYRNGSDATVPGGVSARHQVALVSVQPYTKRPLSPQDEPLAILRELDITDKHKVMLASVISVDSSYHAGPVGYRGSKPIPEAEWGPLKDGEPVIRFRFTEPSPHMKVDFHLVASVSLNEIGAARRAEDAREILTVICREVKHAVTAFVPF